MMQSIKHTLIWMICISCTLTFALISNAELSPQAAIYSNNNIHHPVWSERAMIASQEAVATKVGIHILKSGGNAVDAAVAVGFALAVTLPRAGNIGGGGFMLIYDAKQEKTFAIDYREMAPSKAYRDMYLDEEGNPVPQRSRFHGLAIGVPGTVAGMIKALEEFGSMSLQQVMAPAIKLAKEGMVVTPALADSLKNLESRLKKWPSSAKIFYKQDGYFESGDIIKQLDLAKTLERISNQGIAGFYEGQTAEEIVQAVQQAGGVMTTEDLKNYQVVMREPVMGDYRGFQIASMPPPSSGGTHIIQILNILEGFDLQAMGHNSAETIHHMVESMKMAYADRAQYLADPDFISVPTTGLTSKAYGKVLRQQISPEAARPSADIGAGNPLPYESDETTHYSIVDEFGNAVSNTYTLNFSYGTGLVAEGTGILLNNEMDDFSAKPGVANAYGLIGGEANAVQPKKRPLSSMSPTIVLKDKKPYLITGSPGGSRIITTTLQIIINMLDFQMNVAEATHATRIHHQWLPDEIRIEKNLNKDTIQLLKAKGHKIKPNSVMGSTQSIHVTPYGLLGASDPRRYGALTAGY